jgi:pimeloyl-ACP methyl ester carboxylesterase
MWSSSTVPLPTVQDGAAFYDRLTARGYKVSIVQNPLTSLDADVAATTRVLVRQDGPTILVGHSYGGTVITQAGLHPKVAGLVYVAAFAPEIGQSTMTNMPKCRRRRTSRRRSRLTASRS